jgi:hypothetical protein
VAVGILQRNWPVGAATIAVGANTWTVQPVYSVKDDLASGGRVLPLTCVYFDIETKKIEIRDRELLRYINRLSAPLRRTALPAHLPQLLRQLADALEPTTGDVAQKRS